MIPESTVRAAHDFYMAIPTRSLEEAALEFGTPTSTLQRGFVQLGLPRKGVHEPKRGKASVSRAEVVDGKGYAPASARVVRPNVQRMQRRWR